MNEVAQVPASTLRVTIEQQPVKCGLAEHSPSVNTGGLAHKEDFHYTIEDDVFKEKAETTQEAWNRPGWVERVLYPAW